LSRGCQPKLNTEALAGLPVPPRAKGAAVATGLRSEGRATREGAASRRPRRRAGKENECSATQTCCR
jgi:hypothetical protein